MNVSKVFSFVMQVGSNSSLNSLLFYIQIHNIIYLHLKPSTHTHVVLYLPIYSDKLTLKWNFKQKEEATEA